MVTKLESRNMLQGWCVEGISLENAVERDPHAVWRIRKAFPEESLEEVRAAILLWAFTGLEPHQEDDQSGCGAARDRAVDIVLGPRGAPLGVVEVTRSLDSRYEGASDAAEKLRRSVGALYKGTMAWSLDFKRGWERTNLSRLAPLIAQKLNLAADNGAAFGTAIDVHDLIRAYPMEAASERIAITGRNAGAEDLEVPYLDALSIYLTTDVVIGGKLAKLAKDAAMYGTQHRHLYIHMASSGIRGGLLPVSPSYFTWGTFDPPAGVTDIWLDSAVSTLYHWTMEDGWVFHDLAS